MSTHTPHTRLLVPKEVAARYALHPATVSKYLCGAIEIDLPPAFKIGGQWRFREDDVDAHIDRLSGRAPLEPTGPQPQPQAATQSKPIRKRGAPRKAPRKVAALGAGAGTGDAA